MKNSVESEELIADVKEDIELFGESFKVFAIYSYALVNGQDFEWISSYVDAEKPTRDEIAEPELFDEEDEKLYQKAISDFEHNIESLKQTKHEEMTLVELLIKLVKQNEIM
ncbi:hypothetical protein [Lactococcus protaetiae]|uniref:Uncharacterized protein n=1 Tax=Lactococcus protaetiae TaxID=2592653 RepID=A0A514ZA32_9LACT|nr:hypothetical protein [Lactococcus protaetiae]QDK71444.1 hypothetical protein FLP15_10090 [Lactococcus protaetiae]